MPRVRYRDSWYDLEPAETVLAALRRHGLSMTSSCESGICQTCAMKAVSGTPPADSQKGLRKTQREQGIFLACICAPETDMEVAPADAGQRCVATLASKRFLNERVLECAFTLAEPMAYHAGQFVNLVREDGTVRSYSMANLPDASNQIVLHVGILPGGKMSGWLAEIAEPGDSIDVVGPFGNCFYTPGDPEDPLFLLGTGTGLAPLYGIAQDALAQGHSGPIHLHHGSLAASGLYLKDELRALEAKHETFHYHPCALNGPVDDGIALGSIDAVAKEAHPDLKGWRVYLCGDPDLVKRMQRNTFMAGASMAAIHADAFLPSAG